MPAFGDAIYDFPANPQGEEPATTASVPSGNLPFSSHITSTVDYPGGIQLAYADGREFYNQVPAGGNDVIRHTKGYLEYSWSKAQNSEVVSIAFEDVDGAKIQRIRTEADVSGQLRGRDFSYTLETLEETVIDAAGNVTVTTTSSVIGGTAPEGTFSAAGNDNRRRTRAYDAELSVSEAPAGSSDYAGTLDYTFKNGNQTRFDFTLTALGGLEVNGRNGRVNIRFDNSNVDHGSGNANRNVEVDNMERGGSFRGQVAGNVLTGTYTAPSGATHDIMVTPAMAVIDGDLADGTPGASE